MLPFLPHFCIALEESPASAVTLHLHVALTVLILKVSLLIQSFWPRPADQGEQTGHGSYFLWHFYPLTFYWKSKSAFRIKSFWQLWINECWVGLTRSSRFDVTEPFLRPSAHGGRQYSQRNGCVSLLFIKDITVCCLAPRVVQKWSVWSLSEQNVSVFCFIFVSLEGFDGSFIASSAAEA